MSLRELWHRLTTAPYTHAPEAERAEMRAEIDRLRAENRALLNSILGIAGLPPIVVPAPAHSFSPDENSPSRKGGTVDPHASPRPDKPESSSPRPSLSSDLRLSPEKPPMIAAPAARFPRRSASPAPRAVPSVFPPRRRSWQQVNRMLEIQSGRKKSDDAAP